MKFQSVVVTGGSGRLGRSVVERLAKHCDVTVLDIAPSPSGLPKGVRDSALVFIAVIVFLQFRPNGIVSFKSRGLTA